MKSSTLLFSLSLLSLKLGASESPGFKQPELSLRFDNNCALSPTGAQSISLLIQPQFYQL
ncbi:hypothetical protein [Croceimicrobium hydrocarbonivorans]|uniref:Uncharacterized protein n=1 Tax=Croceimicrobium hydrocarbonivorans TaxID=2761580 RepID=A0A7H0VE03_9FLAO|nr:hypothetical protein [Croceimicrobium hydrocarbonivorans]QNR23951.1 hypothetical protein H4K34_16490 [Croceimicrobium hydrocarbonivorans]